MVLNHGKKLNLHIDVKRGGMNDLEQRSYVDSIKSKILNKHSEKVKLI